MLVIRKLQPPYCSPNISLAAEQRRFVCPSDEVLKSLRHNERPFVVSVHGWDAGFFTLRPGMAENIAPLRKPFSCTLYSLMVDLSFQRRKVARTTLQLLPALAQREFGALHCIYLSVSVENNAALRLYQEAGFYDVGALSYGGPAGEERLMAFSIPPASSHREPAQISQAQKSHLPGAHLTEQIPA